jgi:hypothetical protein
MGWSPQFRVRGVVVVDVDSRTWNLGRSTYPTG